MKLIPFPGTCENAEYEISVSLSWRGPLLDLDFVVKNPNNIRGLTTKSPHHVRTDRLWEKTCFEVFLRPVGGEVYWEVNLAPDGRWAVWKLEGYRSGMSPEARVSHPVVWKTEGDPFYWSLSATLDFHGVPELAVRPVRGSISAVIEEKSLAKSYWSLIHSTEKPDFHYPDHFVLLYENGGWL